MRKLVYICGVAHNGSTVFDLILDRSENLRSVGQLNNLLVPEDPRDGEQADERTRFWTELLNSMTPEQLGELTRVNTAVLKEKALLSHIVRRDARARYAAANREALDRVFERIPETAIIDSSKNVARCIGLLELQDIDVYVIHLIRDVRGFVNSHNLRRRESGKRDQFITPTLIWFAKNVAASWFVRRRAERYAVVRYEDLHGRPDFVIDRLETFLGENLEKSRMAVHGKTALDSSATLGFSGNRILHGRREFFFDPAKSKRTGAYHSRLYWNMLGWLARLWGYRFGGGRR